MIIVIFLGIILGIMIGVFFVPYSIPYEYSTYMAVAIFACLDSVFGGAAAYVRGFFKMNIFISGFFTNAILAAALAFVGDKLGADVYLAAIFVFIYRLFLNFAIIRRYLLEGRINKEQKEDVKLLEVVKEVKKSENIEEMKEEINILNDNKKKPSTKVIVNNLKKNKKHKKSKKN